MAGQVVVYEFGAGRGGGGREVGGRRGKGRTLEQWGLTGGNRIWL